MARVRRPRLGDLLLNEMTADPPLPRQARDALDRLAAQLGVELIDFDVELDAAGDWEAYAEPLGDYWLWDEAMGEWTNIY